MPSPNPAPLTYRDAGVDIDRGNRLVDHIKTLARRTARPEVLAGVGGFGALFQLPAHRYDAPVLVSGADGVGTKLKLAVRTGIHHTIGIDLVAMCANDILAHGAEPLFFLDYFATGRLDSTVAERVMDGISHGCQEAGAALIGGETAEMPGIYGGGEYDLAGFCVGIVEKAHIIDGRTVVPGDALIGLAASGPHSNGYSLIRRVLERTGARLDEEFHGRTLGETLLTPTRIYVRAILALIREIPVRAIAHITGGGLPENLPRVLPAGTRARIHADAWDRPPIFAWLETAGGIETPEMYRTFNCGIGMVLCVPPAHVAATLRMLQQFQQPAWEIGVVESIPGPDLPRPDLPDTAMSPSPETPSARVLIR
uniref:Phosphoribosylformylglycinamidine cyclo-ligase n=1 Tax=Candidatus Kentrum sp. SD TaxID=2126332 RepID=A0A451BLE5_9GAMM|nr:MAG: phosphoribosylformylglycinamidine cyclo-ligase [Candidatus Kentron sp. SD]VFK44125.1 MAG: phosphoribosylformylglycinamidine cyclo-ligase [Candidatus Kentron sp. SD]VFK79125.1 MAG: phosphoribosylformylglycinamidine cyclo-ligase [Candidatus Kentron sp. SD]